MKKIYINLSIIEKTICQALIKIKQNVYQIILVLNTTKKKKK